MKTTYTPTVSKTAWTEFSDMHSGGGQKLDWGKIYIQGDESTARRIFEEKFDRDPDHITCNCCGNDYSVTESSSLEQATGYNRKAEWTDGEYKGGEPIEDFAKRDDILIVYTA